MEISTTRFGPVEIESGDVIRFPEALPGLADCFDWVLLADLENDALAWMQSVQRPEIALAVVSPRRFLPDFQMRVARQELEPLQFDQIARAQVLVIVSKTDRFITLNLKAPLVINLKRRLGRQVITNGELALRHELGGRAPAVKRIA